MPVLTYSPLDLKDLSLLSEPCYLINILKVIRIFFVEEGKKEIPEMIKL